MLAIGILGDSIVKTANIMVTDSKFSLLTDLHIVAGSCPGKTVSLDDKTRIIVPEDRYGLYAIDCLDPDMVSESHVLVIFIISK